MANDSILIQVQLGAPSRASLNAVTRQIQGALSNINANVQIKNGPQAVQSLKKIKTGTDAAKGSMTTFGEAIGLSARRFVAFTSAVAIVGRLTSALSKATREAIKFEREFVKLAQVFDTDVRSLSNLQNSLSDLSREFGLSATVIAKTSVVLAQSGLTARQTEQAMRTLAKTTLAATFDNIAASTEGAVAIMAQFGTEASKLETQLGAINAVSKRFAVESGDIIEAVRRSGGAFRAAGGTLNEFIALFTAVRSTTRESAETIATGFRTIFARLQRPKTIDFFRQLNIELTDGRGNFIGAFEAIKRLSTGLEQAGIKAGSLKFAAIVEQLGGIRQVSRVIPLLQQFAKAERARQVAVAGGGSLDRDAAKAQETLAQAFARTTENFRALIREITQTGTFQAFVKIALGLANAFIEVARAIKPLIPLIAALGALKIGKLASSAIRSGVSGAGGAGGLGKGFNKGGKVLGFNRGGTVPGTGNGDTVPAMLEPGEFVIRKSAVQAFGTDRLSKINKYKGGGRTHKRTGKQLSKLYKSFNKRADIDPDTVYTARVKDVAIKSQEGKSKFDITSKKVIAAMRKSKQGLMWQRFEEAISRVFALKLDRTSGSFLDYPSRPGDAKFLKKGVTYSKWDDKKGNTAETMLAKLVGSGLYNEGTRQITRYYPQNPSQLAAIVHKRGERDKKRKAKPTGRSLPVTKAAGGLIGYANGGAVEVQRFANAGVVGKGTKTTKTKKDKNYGTIELTGGPSAINARYAKGGPGSGHVYARIAKTNPSLYTVDSSSASKGYGPRLYDAVMEKATQRGRKLTSDRSRVSNSAHNVWKYYLQNRADVRKTPLQTKDWYYGPLFDQKKFASEDPNTWPPHSDAAWALNTAYTKSPALIKNRKKVKQFAKGGAVGTDTVPALLTPGEFVINKESAKSFGYGKLGKINKYAKGGPVQKFGGGGDVKSGPTGGGDIVGKLFALSFVFSTLTSMVDGVNKELKPVTDALIAFGLTTVIAYKALEFLMKFQGIQTAAGRGQVKALGGKIKDKFTGGGEKAVEDVEDEVRKSSNSNDKYLKFISKSLLRSEHSLKVIAARTGAAIGGKNRIHAEARSGVNTRRRGKLLNSLGGVAAGAAAPAAGAAAPAAAAAAPQLILLGIAAAAVAAGLGLVVASFTLTASTAEQAKEKAIKAGRQEEAIRNADAESKAKSERNAVIATTAVGAAMGAMLGPAGAIAGAFVGLVAGVLLGGEALNILVPIVHSVAIALIDFAEWVSFGAISLDPLRKAVDGLAAGMLPATSRFNNALDALTKATQAASEEIRQKGQKEFDAEQKAFGLATTDKSRNRSLDKQTKILLDTGGKLDKNNEGFQTKLKEIQVQREKDLKSSNLRIRQAANEKAGEATAAAKAENVKSIQAEASSRLDNISKLADQSRSMGRSVQLERDLNKGKKLTRDQDNIINKSSLQANGELKAVYDGLIAAGATEREALIQVTQSLDGAGSAAKRFSEALKNSSKFVGGVFRKLFTGPLEESFKTARKLNDAMDVAEGSQTIAGLGRERGNGASDAFGQLIGIGAVTGEQTDEAFRGAIPAGAYQGLEDRLRQVNIANDPTGTPEEIEAKVQEGMRKAAEGFFGVDVVAKANQEANVNSAKYLKELAEAERAKKKEDKKANKKAEKSRADIKNRPLQEQGLAATHKAVGGVVYANEGTLVNFQPQGTDTVPAMLTPGEFVMKKSAVDKYGGGMMKQINSGNFAGGGVVRPNYLSNGGGIFDNPEYDKLSEDELKLRIYNDPGNVGLYVAARKKSGKIGESRSKAKKERDKPYGYSMQESVGRDFLQSEIFNQLDSWFVDENKLAKLFEQIPNKTIYDDLNKTNKNVGWGNTNISDKKFDAGGFDELLRNKVLDPMGSHENALRERVKNHYKFLFEGGQILNGKKVTEDEIKEDAEAAKKDAKKIDEYNKKYREAENRLYSGEGRRGSKVILAGGFDPGKNAAETKKIQEESVHADAIEHHKKTEKGRVLESEKRLDRDKILAQRAAEKEKKTEKEETPAIPVPEPKKVDLVQFYESQLGQGPRSGDVDPSKVDLNNPVVVRRLRSNEIAIARAAGAERFKHGGQRIITVGDGSAEQHAKFKTLSDAPTNVDLPYPDMEQVRGGKRVLSNIEREFYAYQGRAQAEGVKAGPFSYFQKNYDAILNRTDPLYKRGASAEKKKAENRKISEAIKEERRSGDKVKRTVRVMEDGKMVSKEMEVPVKSRGQIKRELAQEGMTEAEKEADRPASGGLERKEAREKWKSETKDSAIEKLMQLSSIQRAAIDYATVIRSPLLALDAQEGMGVFESEEEVTNLGSTKTVRRFRNRDEQEQMAFDNSQGAIRELAKPQYEEFRKKLAGEETSITTKKRQEARDAKGLFAEYLVKQRIFPSVAEALKAGRTEYDSDTSLRDRIDSIIGSVDDIRNKRDKIAGLLRGKLTPDPIDYTQYKMPRFNTGGYVNGPAGIDVIPAYLSRGEFVMQSSAVNNIGRDNLTKMNSQNFQNGGSVGGPQTSTMNQEIKVEGGKEMADAGQVLLDAAKTLPTDIQMNVGETSVNVNINGGEVLTALIPQIQGMVGQAVSEQITAYHDSQQSGGGLPPQNYGNTA